MTISEFKQDISSRSCCYTSLLGEDKSLPVEAVIHISEVTAVEEHPAVILFTDGINMMQLTQIQSISLKDDHYIIVCGATEDAQRVVSVYFETPLM